MSCESSTRQSSSPRKSGQMIWSKHFAVIRRSGKAGLFSRLQLFLSPSAYFIVSAIHFSRSYDDRRPE
jgi:hypothetical protein